MKLTKRQLKRIIREEYSRLKRADLIREARSVPIEDQVPYEPDHFPDFGPAGDHQEFWYDYVWEKGGGAAQITKTTERDLQEFGYDRETIEKMIRDRKRFEKAWRDVGWNDMAENWKNWYEMSLERKEEPWWDY
jgi:hypothetical protein